MPISKNFKNLMDAMKKSPTKDKNSSGNNIGPSDKIKKKHGVK